MEKSPSIFLRRTIRIRDCENMIRWIENEHVSRYLNESRTLTREISSLLSRSPEDLLTFHFNQHGCFYLVSGSDGDSIGYAKLQPLSARRYEVVYVIGEEELWGRGFGEKALDQVLSAAFLENRAQAVIARICRGNTRSLRTAARCGMRLVRQDDAMCVFEITEADYWKRSN